MMEARLLNKRTSTNKTKSVRWQWQIISYYCQENCVKAFFRSKLLGNFITDDTSFEKGIPHFTRKHIWYMRNY